MKLNINKLFLPAIIGCCMFFLSGCQNSLNVKPEKEDCSNLLSGVVSVFKSEIRDNNDDEEINENQDSLNSIRYDLISVFILLINGQEQDKNSHETVSKR